MCELPQLTTGDEMRDRIIGALDTACRRGEMMKIQSKHVDWQNRRFRILKEHSKTEVAGVIPLEQGSRLEKLLRRRVFSDPTRTCSDTLPPASTSGAFVQGGRRCCRWPTGAT